MEQEFKVEWQAPVSCICNCKRMGTQFSQRGSFILCHHMVIVKIRQLFKWVYRNQNISCISLVSKKKAIFRPILQSKKKKKNQRTEGSSHIFRLYNILISNFVGLLVHVNTLALSYRPLQKVELPYLLDMCLNL